MSHQLAAIVATHYQQYIARLAECLDLFGKHLVEMFIVGSRRQCGIIRAEGDYCQARPFCFKPIEHARSEILRTGGSTAIAACQNLFLVEQCRDDTSCGLGNGEAVMLPGPVLACRFVQTAC